MVGKASEEVVRKEDERVKETVFDKRSRVPLPLKNINTSTQVTVSKGAGGGPAMTKYIFNIN